MLIEIKWDGRKKKNVRFECLTRQSEMMKPFTLKTANEFDTEQGPYLTLTRFYLLYFSCIIQLYIFKASATYIVVYIEYFCKASLGKSTSSVLLVSVPRPDKCVGLCQEGHPT